MSSSKEPEATTLIVKSLTASWHRDRKVVAYDREHPLSFACPAGSTLAVAGDEGVGRSTLLHALAGTVPYASGKIRLGRRELPHGEPSARFLAGVQHVPEAASVLDEHIDLDDAFRVLRFHRPGLHNELALEHLVDRLVQNGLLPEARDPLPTRLFDLLMALMTAPRVLLMDEVPEALEQGPSNPYPCLRELLPWCTFVIVDRDVERAIREADQALWLRRGEPAEIVAVEGAEAKQGFLRKYWERHRRVNPESGRAPLEFSGLRLAETPGEQIALALRARGRGSEIKKALKRLKKPHDAGGEHDTIAFLASDQPTSRLTRLERSALLWALEALAGMNVERGRARHALPDKTWKQLEAWVSEIKGTDDAGTPGR